MATQVASGSFVQANSKLSVVAGTAFLDFGVSLSSFADGQHEIVITDTGGKTLRGWLKAAGTGETLSGNLLTNSDAGNGDFTGGPPPTGWSVFGTGSLATVAGGQLTTNCMQVTQATGSGVYGQQTMALAAGALIKVVSAYHKNGTGVGRLVILSAGQVYNADGLNDAGWTQRGGVYATNDTGANPTFNAGVNGTINQTTLWDVLDAEQVLTPSVTGATIVSALNGSTANWTNEDSGFNRNDTTYTYVIYSFSNRITTGSVAQANMKLSVVSGTAFVDFSSVNTLTPYIGSTLDIFDSNGKKLSGVIARAGVRETYGSELNTGWINDGIHPYDTFTPSGTTVTVTKTQATNVAYAESPSLTSVSGKLFLQAVSGYVLNSGSAPTYTGMVTTLNPVANGTYYATEVLATRQPYVSNTAPQLTNFTVAISIKQVLTPSSTGVFISSTFGSPTFSWASEETGFNRNDSSGYTYTISSPTGPGGGSLGWVRGPWGYLWAWSGLGCTWQ